MMLLVSSLPGKAIYCQRMKKTTVPHIYLCEAEIFVPHPCIVGDKFAYQPWSMAYFPPPKLSPHKAQQLWSRGIF